MRYLLIVPLVLMASLAVPAGPRLDLSKERIESLDDCDRLVRLHPDALEAYNCYWRLGARLNDRPGAVRRLESLLSIDPDNHAAQLYLAPIRAELGDHAAAEELFKAAARGFAAQGHVSGEGYARTSLAMMFSYFNRVDEALVELERVESIAREAGDAELLGMALGQRGHHATNLGDYGAAWKYYRELESLVFPDGTTQLQSWALSGLGHVGWATKRYRESLAYYRREAELHRRLGQPAREAAVLSNIAALLYELGSESGLVPAEIEQVSVDALESAVSAGNELVESESRFRLALIREDRGGLEQAIKGLEIARRLGRYRELCHGLLVSATCGMTIDPPGIDRALGHVEEALALARDHADLGLVVRALALRGRIRMRAGAREAAVSDLLAALDAAETLRSRQPETEIRARNFSRWQRTYAVAASLVLESGDLELGFKVMERLRARALLDQLEAAGAARARDSGDALHEERAEAVRRIAEVQKRLLYEKLSREARDSLLGMLKEIESEEFTLRTRLADTDANYAMLHRPAIPTVQEVQRELRADQALLSFCLAPGQEKVYPIRSWLLVVTSADVKAYRIPEDGDLDDLVPSYLGLLQRRDELERRAAARLHDQLLRESLRDLDPEVSGLVIVPDGILTRLPFAALRPDPASAPIATRYEITIAPSAATWLRMRRGPEPSGRRSVLAVTAPPPGTGNSGEGARQAVAWTQGDPLGDLPGTRDEAREVVRSLRGDAKLLTGERATEHELKQANLRDYAVLLLATHTVIDEDHPDRTAVFLAPGDEAEDGLLQAREIAALDLDGQVVVLSGCGSATGEYLRGEGVLGVARSFFVAGADTVVGSLWPLEDREAAALVAAFSDRLSRRSSVSAALAAAQRRLQRDGAPTGAWAGMVVLGDGDRVPFPGGRPRGALDWAWLLIPAAVFLLVAVLRTRRRRRSGVDRGRPTAS